MSKLEEISMMFAKLNIAVEDAIKDGVISREAACDAAIFLVACLQEGIAKSDYIETNVYHPKLH